MALVFTELTSENLHSVEGVLLPYLDRNWSRPFIDEFLEWRFLGTKIMETALALDGDRCVAMVNSCSKPHLVEGEKTDVRETDLWLSLPDFRPFASIRVMQMMMKRGQPVCTVTEQEYIRSILQRLKWQKLPSARQMLLPLRGRTAIKAIAKKLNKTVVGVPAAVAWPLGFRIGGPKLQPAPASGATVKEIEHAADLPEILPPASEYSVMPLADRDHFEWYAAAPAAMGDFLWLEFAIDGEPIAITVSRVYPEGGCMGGKLLHVQSTKTDVESYAWILGETSAQISARGADWIDARFTCPKVSDALAKIGYMAGGPDTPFWSSTGEPIDGDRAFVSTLFRGEGLEPYPA